MVIFVAKNVAKNFLKVGKWPKKVGIFSFDENYVFREENRF